MEFIYLIIEIIEEDIPGVVRIVTLQGEGHLPIPQNRLGDLILAHIPERDPQENHAPLLLSKITNLMDQWKAIGMGQGVLEQLNLTVTICKQLFCI